ncbi:hypothetical protein BDZ89DRAFT_1080229 [Hymenopellis radicata]|nr:hypothetical protein BDZ89DRAFT_1080229 [Hymenopellis radicata]
MAPDNKYDRRGDGFIEKVGHMRRLEYWNVSWWVATAYTYGSIVWVINGFLVFLPFCNSSVSANMTATGWTAWLGATIFEFGSVLGLLEAWNRGDVANFGFVVEQKLGYAAKEEEALVEKGIPKKKWVWFSLDPRYFRELGFLAAFVQFWGATIFWISGYTAIPQIFNAIENDTPLFNGVFWSPQVVGGAILMLETQKKWYKPNVTTLRWHVGLWNFIGGIGFTLCDALGYATASASSGAAYQSALATFWGGWAFLIGSVIQWYESVNSV